MIRKVTIDGKTKYRIISHKTGKNLGTFASREAAEKHLKHIRKFR